MALRSLLIAHLSTSGDAAVSGANPIRKVVSMLQAMQKKVEAEGERDKALFDKFMCYCKTGVGQLQKQVGDAQTKMPQLGSDIEEAEASNVQMKQDLKQAQTDRAEAKAAMASATSLRGKEAAEFAKQSSELKTNIAAISKAVSAISAGMGGGFLQTQTAQELMNIVQRSDAIFDVDKQDVMAFLSGGSETAGTGEITGILKQMEEKMSEDLKDLTTTENDAIQSFEQLLAAKNKEVEALNQQIETKLKRIGELAVEIVQMKNDLTDTEAQLLEDQKFLKEITKDCDTKASEYQEIVKTRQAELLALADTIKLLNDDDALELFKKTLPGASALLQVGVDLNTDREKALRAVKRAQDYALNPRPRVDFIAMAIRGKKIGFEKVIQMIDEMVVTLKQEQVDDENKKEYCAAQFDFADDKKKGLERKINGLETTIIDSKDGIARLTDEIGGLEDAIKATDKSVAEMSEQRKDESSEYQETMASDTAAKELLDFAKNRLNKFYNPKLYKPEKAASFVQISMHKQEPPPEAPGAYKKKGEESGGVIAMIDVLIKDLDRGMTEAEATEKNSQKDYEAAMQDAAESRSEMSKSLTNKMAAKADLQADLETATEDEGSSKKELMATESYISSLHAECDWLLKYFDMRKEARQGEIDALGNAKAVLSGANFAFLQTQSRRNLLSMHKAPEDDLAQEMTHDLEMNFNKIAPFGKEDTAKELQDHAAKTQDTLVDAVENAEVAEIKRAVFRALTRLRAATIKEFDTIARLETQAIDAYNDAHHYRAENPLTHLHEDEAPVETDKLKSFH